MGNGCLHVVQGAVGVAVDFDLGKVRVLRDLTEDLKSSSTPSNFLQVSERKGFTRSLAVPHCLVIVVAAAAAQSLVELNLAIERGRKLEAAKEAKGPKRSLSAPASAGA